MELIAHRGFAAERAENTIPALVRAAGIADTVEFDVRRCESGEPVVVHDATVDRVTESSGPVAEYAAEELAGMDVLGSGAGIPTLATALDALPADAAIFLELKESGIAESVLDRVADHDGRIVVISFDSDALREVRALDESIPMAAVADDLGDTPVATALAFDCEAVNVRARLALQPGIRRAARRLGLGVYVWTVTNRASARALQLLGVDGITSDRSDVLPAER